MHRTEGEDFDADVYGDTSNKPGYTPGNPPTVPATRLPAESMNAVQEEFCNLIELAGGTLAVSAAADKAALWRQAYDIIFQSAKIDTSAIAASAVTASKIENGAVSNAKIADTSITDSKLVPGTIESGSIKDDAVITDKIADLNVTTDKVAGAAVTLVKLASEVYSRFQTKTLITAVLTPGATMLTFNNLTQGKVYRVTYIVDVINTLASWSDDWQVVNGAGTVILETNDGNDRSTNKRETIFASLTFTSAATVDGEVLKLNYEGSGSATLQKGTFQLEELPMTNITSAWT